MLGKDVRNDGGYHIVIPHNDIMTGLEVVQPPVVVLLNAFLDSIGDDTDNHPVENEQSNQIGDATCKEHPPVDMSTDVKRVQGIGIYEQIDGSSQGLRSFRVQKSFQSLPEKERSRNETTNVTDSTAARMVICRERLFARVRSMKSLSLFF